ncbi:hypothetical protein Y1Q_0016275 [Alligator mississippiensis]|uniref:Uncharacterized protein n=1 Tax=Alligator mississippiensis TaxID=8496 RepID=A0A151M422_ALLMI|nr:hypothetical protein Y1Q_0016275 [Alligator mississippiensis]
MAECQSVSMIGPFPSPEAHCLPVLGRQRCKLQGPKFCQLMNEMLHILLLLGTTGRREEQKPARHSPDATDISTGKWETMPTEKPKVGKIEKNSPFTGCRREMLMQFISRAHLQLGPGAISKRRHLVKIKVSPKSVGTGMPGAGETAGDCWAESIQSWHGADELAQREAMVEAGAAGDPHARDDKQGSEEPAGRPAAVAARAIEGAPAGGGWHQDSRAEADPGGDKRNPD